MDKFADRYGRRVMNNKLETKLVIETAYIYMDQLKRKKKYFPYVYMEVIIENSNFEYIP